MNSTFDFLREFEILYSKAILFEKDVKNELEISLVSAKNFLNEIIKFLLVNNELEEYLEYPNDEQLKMLEESGILKENIARNIDIFNTIISSCENSNKIEIESIEKMHKILYLLSIKLKEDYSSEDFNSQIYSEKPISDFYGEINSDLPLIGVSSYEESKLYGSYLLYQVVKLSDFSKEVIQNSSNLSKFKEYLHVKRNIQEELQIKIQELENSYKSQLILLCGSVGDGKSHLLAYMNEKYPNTMNKYIIHNDATESFDPHKSAIDTLKNLLMPFSDENINKSTEKMIVAINLGVLNNFLENDFVKEKYKKLNIFIKEAKVFDENTLSRNISKGSFHLISFSDYQMFELIKEGVDSNYINNIFNKIVFKSEKNPFYNAYLKDLRDGNNNIVTYNYEFFQNEQIRKFIVDILIRTILEYKLIISTRALFNFIFDILVPSNIEEKIDLKSVIDITENFLPNLLFESKDKSKLLKIINKYDPINIRTSKIDEMLIDLINSKDIKIFFETNFEDGFIDRWIDDLESIGPFYNLTQESKMLFNKTLIRLVRVNSSKSKTDEDLIYRKYVKCLYYYNSGDSKELKELYGDVKRGLFAWRGGPTQNGNCLYLNNSLDDIRVAQNLTIRPNIDNLNIREEFRKDRFKNSITIAFEEMKSKKIIPLEIDYSLYLILIRVLRGRRPSKKDKEEAVKFIEFLDKLIKLSSIENEIYICDLKEKLIFKLELDEVFGNFVFGRV